MCLQAKGTLGDHGTHVLILYLRRRTQSLWKFQLFPPQEGKCPLRQKGPSVPRALRKTQLEATGFLFFQFFLLHLCLTAFLPS